MAFGATAVLPNSAPRTWPSGTPFKQNSGNEANIRRKGSDMRIGVPKEVKNHEYRVAITPVGVHELVAHGHEVVVERGAGAGSQISDEEYAGAGAKVVGAAEEAWG